MDRLCGQRDPYIREWIRTGFCRSLEGMGPNLGAHYNPGQFLNNSEKIADIRVLTSDYWLEVLLTGLE